MEEIDFFDQVENQIQVQSQEAYVQGKKDGFINNIFQGFREQGHKDGFLIGVASSISVIYPEKYSDLEYQITQLVEQKKYELAVGKIKKTVQQLKLKLDLLDTESDF